MADLDRTLEILDKIANVMEGMNRNTELTAIALKMLFGRFDALEKRITALETPVVPDTKGSIDSDSIFLDDPCTCLPDHELCPACKKQIRGAGEVTDDGLPY